MRRSALFAAAWLATAQALAQNLGTKADVVAKASSGPIVRPMDLIQMVAALAVVAWLLKWLLPKLAGKLSARPKASTGSTITVEESLALGTGQIQVVTVRGRTLLLAVATSGTTFLTDLTTENATQQTPVQDDAPAFFEMLDTAAGRAETAASLPEAAPEDTGGMSMNDAIALISAAKKRLETPAPAGNEALDRLNRLTGGR